MIALAFIFILQFNQPDTLALAADSLQTPSDTSASIIGSSVDTTIIYLAKDSIVFSFKTKLMDMYGDSKMDYGVLKLESGHIGIDWNINELMAEGQPDSTGTIAGEPILNDGGEIYDGTRIFYNFKTRKGRVALAKTEISDGFYYGETIKKETADVLFVREGIYTTCDRPDPHFHFEGEQMKILAGDKIITRPVVLKINHVPVFGLPFAVLPAKSGRSSGILAPTYGESATRGIFLRGLGYYFAINEYTDLTMKTDLYSKSGYNLNSVFNYNLRYNFRGRLNLGYTKGISGEPTDPDYNESTGYLINWTHNQEIDPSSSLSGRVYFSSNNYFRRTSFNPNELLNQEVQSNLSYSKQFEDTPWSLNAGFSRRQNLINDTYSQTLPSLSLNRRTTNPFKDENTPASRMKWYERLSIGYSFSFRNVNNKTIQNQTDTSTTYNYFNDYGAIHSPTINIPFPVAKYFTVTPSFSYREYWYWKTKEKSLSSQTNQIETRDVQGFASARDFSTGISASTRLYGIIQPQIGRLMGIRHVLQPSISYSYRPDFSDSYWGYYKTVNDSTGKEIKYSRFEGSIIGGPSPGTVSAINFSLQNILEMKLRGEPTEDGKPSKDQVIPILRNLSISSGYNFAADSLNWANVSINANTNIGNNFSVNYNSRYTPYFYASTYNPITKTYSEGITRFTLWEKGKGLLRSLSQALSFSFNLSGRKKERKDRLGYEREADPLEILTPAEQRKQQLDNVDFDIPWSLNLSASFSYNTPTPRQITRYAFVSGYLDFSLTPNWKMGLDGGYDFIRKEFSLPTLTVSRDLHCWQMDFTWRPAGPYTYYSLSIHVKAPQLQDISYKQTRSHIDQFN